MAPLFFLVAAGAIVQLLPKGGSDQSIAAGCMGLLIGTLATGMGSFWLYHLLQGSLLHSHLRNVQIADALLLTGWLVAVVLILRAEPVKLTYSEAKAVLEVELRAGKTLLEGGSIDSVACISFVGGDNLNYPHPELVRRETDYQILPWETTVLDVQEWKVLVFWKGKEVPFMLDLPKRPVQSTRWSGWQNPHQQVLPGLMLRYRFRIVPYRQQ
jgi:hypothetical protein